MQKKLIDKLCIPPRFHNEVHGNSEMIHSFCLSCRHTGDILGSSMNNLDRLVRMPYGCGEQNMVNFAPNIYVLKYLQTVNQLTTLLENKAKRYMISG